MPMMLILVRTMGTVRLILFRETVRTNRESETAIQGHSRSSVVVKIDAAYMSSY